MTANELIDALGGNAEVAKIAGVKGPAVSNWRRYGYLPPRLYMRVASAARAKGVEVPEHLFREMSDAERAPAEQLAKSAAAE